MTESPHISAEDLALLALGALTPEEIAVCEPHLATCERCRSGLAELRGDAALLAYTAPPRQLPAAARERFLASIGAPPAAKAPAPVVSIASRSVSSGRLRFWQGIAALLVIALGLHAYKVHQLEARLESSDAQTAALRNDYEALRTNDAKARQVLQVLTAQDAQHIVLASTHASPEPEGHLTYIASSGSLVFEASHLKPLPAGKTYELWVIPANGSAPIPAGIFQPDIAGNGSVVLPPLPAGVPAKAFGVTMERAAGADAPTLPILLVGATG